MNFDIFDNSHNSFLWPEYFIDYLCERWIPCQASTSVLCLHYRPVTVHCSTKDEYTSEITFLALNPCSLLNVFTVTRGQFNNTFLQCMSHFYQHFLSYSKILKLYVFLIICPKPSLTLFEFIYCIFTKVLHW